MFLGVDQGVEDTVLLDAYYSHPSPSTTRRGTDLTLLGVVHTVAHGAWTYCGRLTLNDRMWGEASDTGWAASQGVLPIGSEGIVVDGPSSRRHNSAEEPVTATVMHEENQLTLYV